MARPALKARLSYAFDKAMARGTLPLLGWLLACIAAFIVIVSAVLDLLQRNPVSHLPVLMWDSLLRAFDLASVIDDTRLHDGGAVFIAAMFIVSLVGIFVVAVLIGLVTTGMEQRLRDLRRGRSRVIESGHTLILGWSPHASTVVRELVLANANQPRSGIVILADQDPLELRDEIKTQVGPTGKTRVICRRGNPTSFDDLEIASFASSRSIIILPAPHHDGPDCLEVKTLLAVIHHPHRPPTPFHVVLGMHDVHNASVAKMVGRDEVEVIEYRDLIARILAQASQQPGLSMVYTELLQFSGNEIYFQAEPGLEGMTFGDALLAFATSSPIGVVTAGGAHLNPPMATVINPGDQIIAISEDDDTILLSGDVPPVDESRIRSRAGGNGVPARTLILGWNEGVPEIVKQLDNYVPEGSSVTLVANTADGDGSTMGVGVSARNLTVQCKSADPANRAILDDLDVPGYHHVIVCEPDGRDPQRADAQALLTLLHLRHIKQSRGADFSIVTEMNDARNRDLAAVAEADDFVVSEHLMTLVLTQISENKRLRVILDDLFDPEGSEIYLKPAGDYVQTDTPLSFYTVVESARRRGEAAIGYRVGACSRDSARNFGVVINPDKRVPVVLSEDDKVLVVAEC